jgi:hypothetical protein
MTISSTTNRVSYTGNGVTTAFAFGYKFLADADLKVYKDGTLQTITTHYTVSGAGSDSGGTVTFLAAPANGLEIVILRDPAITQGLDLVENDPLPAESVEDAFDKLTMIAQRLDDRMDRALILSDTETASITLTLPTPDAGKALVWNATEDALENSTYAVDDAAAAAAASAAAASASASAASTSASNASTSASAAATSASNAATSETNAAASAAAAAASAANSVLKDGTSVMTGSLQMGAGTGVVFEGTTDNAFETTLVAGDPTADRTVTLPDATTTLAGLAVAQTFTATQTPDNGTDSVSATGTYTFDGADQVREITLTNAITVTFGAPTGITENAMYIFKLKAGDTSARTFAWNSAYKFPAATPKLTSGTTTSGAKDNITFIGGPSNTLEYMGHQADLR